MTAQTGACVYVGITAPGPDGKLREIRWSIAIPPEQLADPAADPVTDGLRRAVAVVLDQWETR